MRTGLLLASTVALACAGCASVQEPAVASPVAQVQPEPRSASALVVDGGARSMEIRVEDRMEEAERLLVRWVEVAGGVVSATPGVREARWERKRGENPPRILRWRPSGHRIEVQAASEDWPSATWCSASLDSLEFVLEAAGFDVEKGPSTGCLLTWDPPPSGVSLTRAMDDEMASRGFSRIAEEGGVDCWAVLFGKDGTPEWRVECVVWTRVMVLDVSHVSVPFDATGEREVMTGILRRLGLKP